MRHLTLLLAAGAVIAVTAVCAARAGEAPLAPEVSIDHPEAFKGASRVAIGSFTVDILDRQEATADISGIELVTGAPSDLIVTLVGADPARYQALVDDAYAHFTADLTKAGYTVVPQAELAANADYQKTLPRDGVREHDEKSPAGRNHYISAQGLPMFLVDETALFPKMEFHFLGPKPKHDPYIGWATGFGAGFAQMGFERQRAVAKSLNAQILNVRITLLAGQARIDHAFWRASGTAKTDAAMTFVPLYNRILAVNPTGAHGRVALGQGVTTEKLGDLVSTTSATTKGAQTLGNGAIAASRVLGAFGAFGGGAGLIGHMHYSNKSTYEVRTDEAVFETALNKGFDQVSGILTKGVVEAGK